MLPQSTNVTLGTERAAHPCGDTGLGILRDSADKKKKKKSPHCFIILGCNMIIKVLKLDFKM